MTIRKTPKSDPVADTAAEIICSQGLLECERAHLQKQLVQLNGGDGMLRFSDEQPAQPGPKKSAMAWRVRRQFNAGDQAYPVGSELTEAEAAKLKNFAALKGGHFIELLPRLNGSAVAKPRVRAPAPVVHNAPVVVTVVPHADPVQRYKLTLEATAKACGNDYGKAKDLIARQCSEVYTDAEKANYARQAGGNRRPVNVSRIG